MIASRLGMAAAYADVIFITQSLSFKTNLARYLYIVPPITVLPASYLVSREMLSAMSKDENSLWPYIWAAAAPASIWTTFRKFKFETNQASHSISIDHLRTLYIYITGLIFF